MRVLLFAVRVVVVVVVVWEMMIILDESRHTRATIYIALIVEEGVNKRETYPRRVCVSIVAAH